MNQLPDWASQFLSMARDLHDPPAPEIRLRLWRELASLVARSEGPAGHGEAISTPPTVPSSIRRGCVH